MEVKRNVWRNIIVVLWGIYIIGNGEYLSAETARLKEAPSTVTKAQQQAIREQTQEIIRSAKQAFNTQDYTAALRMLYDAYYQERKAHIPLDAYHEISEIVGFFLKESNPLMEYLRNNKISIFERIALLDQLKALAQEQDQSGANKSFQSLYQGTLVNIVLSPQLTPKEKVEILTLIEHNIQKGWVSPVQKAQLIEEMRQDQTLAEQQFQIRNYVEMFRLLAEANTIHGALMLGSHESTVAYQYLLYAMHIAHSAQSPLLELLRNPEVPLSEKHVILAELKELASQTFQEEKQIMFRGQYTGPLVQILTTPKLTTENKLDILGYVQEAVEKEFSTIP